MDKNTMEAIRVAVDEAEMVLVGLGEEWDDFRVLKNNVIYEKGRACLEKLDLTWILPAWNDFCLQEIGSRASRALETLRNLLEGKNYFVVSTATNGQIARRLWREDRLVMPCGRADLKQCRSTCAQKVIELTEGEQEKMKVLLQFLWNGCKNATTNDPLSKVQEMELVSLSKAMLGKCDFCEEDFQLNSVYTDDYKEAGYLEQWSLYTRWLQGTVNRKLLILELGVGMKFPTVIRFPFEKVAFYNQKCRFVRINEKLYQLTPELKEKGLSVCENVVDCFGTLC